MTKKRPDSPGAAVTSISATLMPRALALDPRSSHVPLSEVQAGHHGAMLIKKVEKNV